MSRLDKQQFHKELSQLVVTYGYGGRLLAVNWTTLEEYFQINKRTLMRYVDFLAEKGLINKRRGYRCIIFILQDDKSVNLLDSKVTKVSSYSVQDDKKCHLTTTKVSSEAGRYNDIGVVGVVGDRREVYIGVRSNTDTKVYADYNKVYADSSAHNKKNEKDKLMAREPNQGPPIPKTGIKVSEIANEEHEFPYVKLATHISAIWYWAIERYKRHGIDMAFTGTTFGKMAVKYSQGVGKFLGKEWEKHEDYIDWYLTQSDKFTRVECKFNERYLSSLTCYNRWTEEPTDEGFVDDLEASRTTGRWIREDD